MRETSAQRATCVDLGYPQDSDDVVSGKPLSFRTNIQISDADLVLMMDVIEHVQDDVALVKDYVSKVSVGTRFIISVPAFMWLWSGHDVFLEHYRRYTLTQLEGVLRDAGLKIERSNYFYGLVLPLVAAVRFINKLKREKPESDMSRQGAFVNSILYNMCNFETKFMQANRLGGTTVFVQAVKI